MSTCQWGGGANSIFTNAFSEWMKNNIKKVIKHKKIVCDQRVSQKVGARQRCNACAKTQNRDTFQYFTSMHDMHPSGILRAEFADFLLRKILFRFSNLLIYVFVSLLGTDVPWRKKIKSIQVNSTLTSHPPKPFTVLLFLLGNYT